MPTYRVLYTENTRQDGGWYADVTADDIAAAAWTQAVASTTADPERPPLLVAIAQISD